MLKMGHQYFMQNAKLYLKKKKYNIIINLHSCRFLQLQNKWHAKNCALVHMASRFDKVKS
jgi:hypothetical protein